MYVPPPPPPPPTPGAQKKSSALVPLLIFGGITLVTIVAAIAAGLMVYVSMRDREAHPPASELPVVEKPREPEPPPAFVEPAPPPPPSEALDAARAGRDPGAPVPPSPDAVRIGDDIVAPTKIRNVNPVYPRIAQSARIQGTVVIEATIGPDGKVRETRVLRSIPLLDQAALEAVQQWEYAPTRLNGVAVPVIVTVKVNFTLR